MVTESIALRRPGERNALPMVRRTGHQDAGILLGMDSIQIPYFETNFHKDLLS